MKLETEITTLTLNCWGIVGVSKDRIPRCEAISDLLASGKYDFVFLQEVWAEEDYNRIKTKTLEVLPYSHYFYSGVIGAGICIFSKSPIMEVFFHQWAVNGYVHKIHHGDWFGGKGFGLCKVLHEGLNIYLYTAHLHAEYNRDADEYFAHRIVQAYELSQFIHVTSDAADVAILGADLNTEPGDLAYRLVLNNAHFQDAYVQGNKLVNSESLLGMGGTNETATNYYTPSKALESNPQGKRIDFIMYRPGCSVRVDILKCTLPLPDRIPGKSFSYSDHEAVLATMKINKSCDGESTTGFKHMKFSPVPSDSIAHSQCLTEGIESCNNALNKLTTDRRSYFLIAMMSLATLLSTTYVTLPWFPDFFITLFRLLVFCLICFSVFMGSLWNRMEVHAILAGKLGMEVNLRNKLQEVESAKND